MNFKIIDGTDDTPYDDILTDYQNLELSVAEIRTKYNLSMGKWQSITREWKQDGITLRGRQNQRKRKYTKNYIGAKNYSYDKRQDTYRVYKKINGKNHYFGSYDTEEEAQYRVEYLKKNNWEGLLE